jgi:4-hydroxy-3-methylbut-2-enyl diphosphate reductase
MRVLLANPRGFCAGVDRAIEIVELALRRFGAPVYVRHEIVHNRHVVEGLRKKGAVFIEDPIDAPTGAYLPRCGRRRPARVSAASTPPAHSSQKFM